MADKKFLWFVGKFLLLFCLFYYGTLAWIGLSAPGGLYSPFIEQYLDFVSWIKQSLSWATIKISGWAGYETMALPDYVVRIKNGAGIKIAMDCVGYGVYSFWAAYVLANDGKFEKKIYWITGGILLLWLINAFRISMVLLFMQQGKKMPLEIDHHDWFTIIAYIVIFGMIWAFEKRKSTEERKEEKKSGVRNYNNKQTYL